MTDKDKLAEIRVMLADELMVYPGDDALRVIRRILDILNSH